ncbi:MAG: hypothetical protein KF760_08165 [Candidatus Eremiobacteraeota bacterium]|nr:hypothetical protein [Candidatus Eremiobacteraeota bacterium]MCW5867957.1 hypothetical protein [Candidatus Eremiobacteraeota bacterium]
MNSPTEELWVALSEHFLDTETRHWLPRTAWAGVRSKMSWAGIKATLQHQVAPVVAPNLLDMAGDWAGFPEDWLFTQIRACSGPTSISRRILKEMAPHWEALRRLFIHLSSSSEEELPLLSALAELALERRWARCYRLFEHLKLFCARPWSEVCAAQRLVQEVYRPLLIHRDDPSLEDARRNWHWLEQYCQWARHSPYAAECEGLQFLFLEGDLSQHARVLELRNGPPELRACLEGPLALLYEDPELGLRNWDRYVAF